MQCETVQMKRVRIYSSRNEGIVSTWASFAEERKMQENAEKQKRQDRLDAWYQAIGYNITWYRRMRGLTQEALADRLDISRSHLAAVEAPNSRRRLSMDLLYRIAQELQVTPAELMKMRNAPPDFTKKRLT